MRHPSCQQQLWQEILVHARMGTEWSVQCTKVVVTRCRYSMSNLSLARHDYELEPDSMNHVYLDHKHMGLGGDDSWSPSVHEVIPNDAVIFLHNATVVMQRSQADMSTDLYHRHCISVKQLHAHCLSVLYAYVMARPGDWCMIVPKGSENCMDSVCKLR